METIKSIGKELLGRKKQLLSNNSFIKDVNISLECHHEGSGARDVFKVAIKTVLILEDGSEWFDLCTKNPFKEGDLQNMFRTADAVINRQFNCILGEKARQEADALLKEAGAL